MCEVGLPQAVGYFTLPLFRTACSTGGASQGRRIWIQKLAPLSSTSSLASRARVFSPSASSMERGGPDVLKALAHLPVPSRAVRSAAFRAWARHRMHLPQLPDRHLRLDLRRHREPVHRVFAGADRAVRRSRSGSGPPLRCETTPNRSSGRTSVFFPAPAPPGRSAVRPSFSG